MPPPRKHLPTIVRGGVGLGALGLAIGIFAILVATKQSPERSENNFQPPSVRVIVVSPQPIARSYPGHGEVRAMASADIPAQVAGRVQSRPADIEDGARVYAGQTIVQIESRDFENRVQASVQRIAAIDARIETLAIEEKGLLARLALADEEVHIEQADLDRAIRTVRDGGGIQVDIDRAQAILKRVSREALALRQAADSIGPRRAQLVAERLAEEHNHAIAQADLERTTITAPIEGYLQSVDVEADEWVNRGQRIARVVSLERLEVPLEVPVSAASTIRVGDDADLVADSPSGTPWSGRVSRISPEASRSTRSMTVYIEIDQHFDPSSGTIAPAGRAILLPGQYVVGRVRSGLTIDRIVVPRRAIVDGEVFIAESHTTDAGEVYVVRRRPVVEGEHIEGSFEHIDPDETQWAVLEDGLKEGDRVVVSSLDELAEGLVIEIVPLSRAAPR